MSDHKYIYLQPKCCVDSTYGRLWCEDPDPEDCEDGKHWTKYVLAEEIDRLTKALDRLKKIEEAAYKLYRVSNTLLNDIGMHGQIDSNNVNVNYLMSIMNDIDGGIYGKGILKKALEND